MARNKLVERFKAVFNSSSTNRSLYNERRAEILEVLGKVQRILDARGTGLLVPGALMAQEQEFTRLSGRLVQIDAMAKTDPADAVAELTELEDPSTGLLVETKAARKLAEQAEKERRSLVEEIEHYLLAARGDFAAMVEYLGGLGPKGMQDQLGEIALTEDSDLPAMLERVKTLADVCSAQRGVVRALVALPISNELPQERIEAAAEAKGRAISGLLDANLEAAWAGIGELDDVLKSGNRGLDAKREVSGAEPEEVYARWKLRMEDVLDYPAEHASEEVVRLQGAVKKAKLAYEKAAQPRAELAAFLEKYDAEIDEAPPMLCLEASFSLPDLQKAVVALTERVQEAAGPLRAHDAEVRRYYKRLKELKPRLTMADALPLVVKTVDAAWKAEKEAYVLAKAAVKAEVDPPKRDFKAGNLALDELVEKLDALSKKRIDALDTEVDTATTGPKGGAKKSKALVTELLKTPGLIAEMKPAQQLKLLESLRTKLVSCTGCDISMTADEFTAAKFKCPTCNKQDQIDAPVRCKDNDCCRTRTLQEANSPCPDCGTVGVTWALEMTSAFTLSGGGTRRHPNRELLESRAEIFAQMRITPEFTEFDKDKRKKIVKAVREDPSFKEAEDRENGWSKWARDGDTVKMETFLNSVLKKQWEILAPGLKNLTRDVGGTVHQFPDFPVKVKFFNDPDPDLFGQCKPGFPTWIEINLNGSYIGDFKEQVDTIIHENMHAFQMMLIAGLRGSDPFSDGVKRTEILNDPQLSTQAQMFDENFRTYIHSESFDTNPGILLSDRAYRHEPVEEHAWTTGGKSSQALLVPPQVRSFQSKRGLKDKLFFVESVERANKPKVRLRERHGIYSAEWEGERAFQKRLVLEGVKRNKALVAIPARIVEVVDEFTLQLNVDLRAYDALVTTTGNQKDGFVETTDNDKVAIASARLVLDETVTDL